MLLERTCIMQLLYNNKNKNKRPLTLKNMPPTNELYAAVCYQICELALLYYCIIMILTPNTVLLYIIIYVYHSDLIFYFFI